MISISFSNSFVADLGKNLADCETFLIDNATQESNNFLPESATIYKVQTNLKAYGDHTEPPRLTYYINIYNIIYYIMRLQKCLLYKNRFVGQKIPLKCIQNNNDREQLSRLSIFTEYRVYR